MIRIDSSNFSAGWNYEPAGYHGWSCHRVSPNFGWRSLWKVSLQDFARYQETAFCCGTIFFLGSFNSTNKIERSSFHQCICHPFPIHFPRDFQEVPWNLPNDPKTADTTSLLFGVPRAPPEPRRIWWIFGFSLGKSNIAKHVWWHWGGIISMVFPWFLGNIRSIWDRLKIVNIWRSTPLKYHILGGWK